MQLAESDIKTKEILAWKGLHLLHYDLSSCSQKVRILIGELDIDYISHPINLMRDEQRTDWYLGINSRGQVPVLVHDGAVHIESNDIIEYLDQAFAKADSSLLATNSVEQQKMQELMNLEDQLHPDLRTITFTYLAPDPSDHAPQVSGEDLGYIDRFHDACVLLNKALSDQPFLLGDRITLADISWFITLHRLKLAGFPLQNHPKLEAYRVRMTNRPAFRKELSAGPLLLRFAGTIYQKLNQLFRRSLSKDYESWRKSAVSD